MLECLKKDGEAIKSFRGRYDEKIEEVNKKMQKIEEALKKIMENSVAMLRVSATDMNALVTRLEKMHNEGNFVDLEKDVGVTTTKDTP